MSLCTHPELSKKKVKSSMGCHSSTIGTLLIDMTFIKIYNCFSFVLSKGES